MCSLMEIQYTKNHIQLNNKELSELDKFVKEFIKIVEHYFKYVIISGYVAILFGRNRSSEDIDIFIEKSDFDTFNQFWIDTQETFECINTNVPTEAFDQYLSDNIPIRFSRKHEFVPNVELKFPKSTLDKWSLTERKQVSVNKYRLFISPLELQIPYKLYLGSQKDIEDARFLYRIFEDNLDQDILYQFNQKLKTIESFKTYIE